MTTLDELLVKQLREHASYLRAMDESTHSEIVLQSIAAMEAAADALEAVARENERLREALVPFAVVADEYDDREDDGFEVWKDAGPIRTIRSTFKLGMYRIARNALSGGPHE